jgi:hypothetical protein
MGGAQTRGARIDGLALATVETKSTCNAASAQNPRNA